MSLQKGAIFRTCDAVIEACDSFSKAQQREYKIERRKKNRLVLICPSGKDCNSRINATRSDNRWKLGRVNLNHTCGGGVKRKRSVKTIVQAKTVTILKDFVPTAQGGNIKQLGQMVENQGTKLKTGQLHRIIAEKSEHTLLAAASQFDYLEGFIKALELCDPQGTYLVDVDEDFPQGCRLVQWYIAPSAFKSWWICARKCQAVDATFLTGPIRGNLMTAVGKDANNQLLPLAFSQVETESTATWHSFLLHLRADFPGMKVVFCDAQKGLQACKTAFGLTDIVFCRCACHLIENCCAAVKLRRSS